MKIISSARLNSMQDIVKRQAGTIRDFIKEINRLERENLMQAERIAELEGLLFGYGIIDRDGQLRSNATEQAKIVNAVLEHLKEGGLVE